MAISTLLGGQFLNHFTSLNAQELREGHRLYKGTKFYNAGPGNTIDSEGTLDSAVGNSWDMIVARSKMDLEAFLSFRRLSNTSIPLDKFKIDIFGFSRGAVMAVDLARQIQKGVHVRDFDGRIVTTPYLKVRFLGLFDPVSSSTRGGDFTNDNGLSVMFDSSKNMLVLFIPTNVEHGLNLIAQHESRPLFPGSYATGVALNFQGHSRVDADGVYRFSSTVANVSVPGRHCDIGGFYSSNIYTQQISLAAMMQRARNAGVEFNENSYKDAEMQKYYDSPFRRIGVTPFVTTFMHFRTSADPAAIQQFKDFNTTLANFRVLTPEEAREDIIKNVGSRSHFAPGAAGVQYRNPLLNIPFFDGVGGYEGIKRTLLPWSSDLQVDRYRDVLAPNILREFFPVPDEGLSNWFREMHRLRPNPMGRTGFSTAVMPE